MQERRTTGVVLAAGAGTRLGLGPKALLPYRGRPLVEAIAGTLLDGGCREVVVVLGAGAVDVVAASPSWAAAGPSSIRTGSPAWAVRSCSVNATADPADHLLVALVDQPGLTPETVARLLAAHRPGRITAAAYRRVIAMAAVPSATPARPSAAHRRLAAGRCCRNGDG